MRRWGRTALRPPPARCCGGLALQGLLIAALALPASRANGGEWRITPFAELRETVTDNVGLSEDDRTLDLISTTEAGASVRGDGARANVTFDFAGSFDKYVERTDLDGFRYRALGLASMEVVEDLFFVEARGAVQQESLDRDTTPGTDRTIEENASQVVNYSVSPHLNSRFGGWADGELRYRFSEQRFIEPDTGGTTDQPNGAQTHQGSATLTSGQEFGRLRWTLRGDTTRTEREDDDLFRPYSALATAEYAVTRQWIPLARVGIDEIVSDDLDDDRSGLTWAVGLRVVPSPRSSLEVTYGRRFGDGDLSLSGQFAPSPAITVQAQISQSAQTQQGRLGNNLANLVLSDTGDLIDPSTGTIVDPNQTDFDFRDRTFVQQRANLSFLGSFQRTNASVSFFYTTREFDQPQEEEKLIGSSATLTHALSPTLDVSLSFNHSQVTQALAGDDEDLRLGFGANVDVELGPTVRLGVGYRRTQFSGGTEDFVENVGFVTVRKEF